jgi:hypothetical protein
VAPIQPRNTIENAKAKTRSGYTEALARHRLSWRAKRYRDGTLNVDALTSYEREELCVYLLEHPRSRRGAA